MSTEESIVFIASSEVESMLELSSEVLANLSSAKVVLAVKLSSGEIVYPAFQFKGTELHPELIVSLQAFKSNLSAWEITCWFHRWSPNLQATPLRLIGSKEGLARLLFAVKAERAIASL